MTDADSTQEEESSSILAPFSGFSSHSFGTPSWTTTESGISSFFLVYLGLLAGCLLCCERLEVWKLSTGQGVFSVVKRVR